jgi:dipeptidase D
MFENLKPSLLWKHFEQILKIPHCSGNEKALGDYVLDVAKKLNLSGKRDKVGNVIVAKKATPGREAAPGTILQVHLDMVCEKNSDVVHDFCADAILAEIKGEWVQAKGTTLGSDNGIGVATCLAVMEDSTLVHGPLEFLFTVDEETGLTGATKIQKSALSARKLLNLDTEEEGTFTIGCAGGEDSEIVFPLKRTNRRGKSLFRFKLYGLRGGHSGLDINLGRGNAIKLLARILWQAQKAHRFDLVSIEGGNKRNAIPREAWSDLLLDPAQMKAFSAFLKKAIAKVQTEYRVVEPDMKYSLEKVEDAKAAPLAPDVQKKFVDFLFSLPHGVLAMHSEIAGLVETSTNLAIVRFSPNRAEVVCSSRSSVASALAATLNLLEACCNLAGAKIVQPGGYPGWAPDLDSALLRTLKEVYVRVFNKEAEIKAVHAGLECGILGERFPGMDMISLGPTIQHPHSPEERVHVGSVEKFWTFLTEVLKGIN